MVMIREVMDIMEKWAPSSLAETWDNTGLLVGESASEISHIIIALDVTEKTLRSAEKNGPALVISHHPPIFKPLYNFTSRNLSAKLIKHALKHDIALFAAHTNLDQVSGGVSWSLAEILGLNSISFLSSGTAGLVKFITFVPPEYTDKILEAAGYAGAGVIGEYSFCSFTTAGTGTYKPSENADPFEGKPGELSRSPENRIEMIVPEPLISQVIEAIHNVHPYEEMAYDIIPLRGKHKAFGYGAVGEFETPMNQGDFLDHITRTLDIEALRTSSGMDKPVQKVAVMGGSGGKFIETAVDSCADAFVTGDLGYHDFMTYNDDILLVDASHKATELPVLEKIRERFMSSSISEHIAVSIDKGQ